MILSQRMGIRKVKLMVIHLLSPLINFNKLKDRIQLIQSAKAQQNSDYKNKLPYQYYHKI